jgi:hypothetical protein
MVVIGPPKLALLREDSASRAVGKWACGRRRPSAAPADGLPKRRPRRLAEAGPIGLPEAAEMIDAGALNDVDFLPPEASA